MQNKKLRIWWIPQVPGQGDPFYVSVESLKEAELIYNTLSKYDLYQYMNRIKPDYTNVGGLQEQDNKDDDWCDWYSELGESFDEYLDAEEEKREKEK